MTQATIPLNDFALISAESPLRDEMTVRAEEVAPMEETLPLSFPVRAFPTWEDGFRFLLNIHEEIALDKLALMERRGDV